MDESRLHVQIVVVDPWQLHDGDAVLGERRPNAVEHACEIGISVGVFIKLAGLAGAGHLALAVLGRVLQVRLRTGATKVFVNVGIATTGIDWPWVSCLSMCRPTQSPMLWV